MKNLLLILILVFITFSCGREDETKRKIVTKPVVKEIIKYKKEFAGPLGMDFVYIKPGSFQMGMLNDVPEGYTKYSHKVTLTKGFYMQKTETTVGTFKHFVKKTKYITQAEKDEYQTIYYFDRNYDDFSDKRYEKDCSWRNPGFKVTDKHPVTLVSWEDAKAFIKWLNRKYKDHYRLPTEAEWEYACRAGTKTHFYNGNLKEMERYKEYLPDTNLNKIAWYDWNSDGYAHPVGLKQPNKWGLYDMLGNVSEYCEDEYSYTFNLGVKPVIDPVMKYMDNDGIVRRGGGWWLPPYFNICSDRDHCAQKYCDNLIGIRLVKDVSPNDLKDEFRTKPEKNKKQ